MLDLQGLTHCSLILDDLRALVAHVYEAKEALAGAGIESDPGRQDTEKLDVVMVP